MISPVFSALDIATLMAKPGETPLTPTLEQQAIIEAVPTGTVLVVAGAGSGKTETIANRVIWLVANGAVRPGEILGLTFTRKAAGELSDRMRGRLMTFAERARHAALSTEQRQRIDEIHDFLTTSLELPEVSTYNAFASALVQEFGSVVGLGGQLIDDAVAWSIAREVVTGSSDPRLATLGMSVDRLTELTLQLAHSVSDHLSSFDAARESLSAFTKVAELPYDDAALQAGRRGEKVYAKIASQVEDTQKSLVLIELAEAYARIKRERGLLEFSDQVALAGEAIEAVPDALPVLRQRYRAVLLDEVQDTSVAQTELLSHIFRGTHVMAVGDPHQSIYGWRGASTVSLSGFHDAFSPSPTSARRTLTLSTSWRNARSILDVANRVSIPLRAASTVHVPILQARPEAPEGEVFVEYVETLADEASAVARWMAERRDEHVSQHGELPTAAIIFRKRKYMALFADALAAEKVPSRIVGIGGLLATPEVRDLISTLRCVWYADSSNDLVRILTGPRFAVAPADIAGLRTAARWFAKRDHAHQPVDTAKLSKGELESLDRQVTLVDALDLIPQLQSGHQAVQGISATGMERLIEASQMLRRLRGLIGGEVVDLFRVTLRELRLDIELEAHERYTRLPSSYARENIHALIEAVRAFLHITSDRSLRAVLEWLEYSERDDALPAYIPPAEPGTVQLITVHSSKGLEWDYVAVPRQSQGEFPSKPRSSRGELAPGTIPDSCRGDAASRPVFGWHGCATQQEVRDEMARYQEAQKALLAEEELRLIYVAYTRAKERLFLTGSFWGGGMRPTAPSEPLLALTADYEGAYAHAVEKFDEPQRDLPLVHDFPRHSTHDTRPDSGQRNTVDWPLDPLGSRRDRVFQAAQALREAERSEQPDELAELLIAEEQDGLQNLEQPKLFDRVNASAFHDIVNNPGEALARALRPLPQRPFRRTRIGNVFHAWVEQRTTTPRGTALELDIRELSDTENFDVQEREELQRLIHTFERSRWATLQPIMVEEQITIPFAGRRAVCKLDAVYRTAGRVEIVDWKTGRPPTTQREREDRFLQLDLYRVAYAMHTGTPLEEIDVTLYYIEKDFELQSREPRSLETLERLWREAFEADAL